MLPNYLNKIKTEGPLKTWIEAQRKASKKIVFTNGVFDILHRGHVYYLNQSLEKGDVLVVGLNSDASVKRLGKGNDRPINSENARAEVLAGLSCVSAVIVFDQDTPINLISTIQPDVLIKGGDYDPSIQDKSSKKYIVGSDIVKKNGGKVAVINTFEGYSTTKIIRKINE